MEKRYEVINLLPKQFNTWDLAKDAIDALELYGMSEEPGIYSFVRGSPGHWKPVGDQGICLDNDRLYILVREDGTMEIVEVSFLGCSDGCCHIQRMFPLRIKNIKKEIVGTPVESVFT